MSELTYGISLDDETPEVVDRFKEMLFVVRCDYKEDKSGAIFVPDKKGVAMMNLLINIRNNRK
tara:strand:- start:327 stop:515 length:189 start_codon:yes stop_codon:yes gene_type:complete